VKLSASGCAAVTGPWMPISTPYTRVLRPLVQSLKHPAAVPGSREHHTWIGGPSGGRRSVPTGSDTHGRRLYTMEVSLVSGPVAERFARANPAVARTIEIRGDQTLAHLHSAIFRAFDREEEHLYEFRSE
jgi:hypothetical protein